MARLEKRFWDSQTWVSRRPRPDDDPSGIFGAFVPDRLCGWSPTLDSRTWQHTRIAEDTAKAAWAAVGSDATEHAHWLLVHLESTASSLIEGVDVSPRRLALAEAEMTLVGRRPQRVELEAIGDVAAIEHALRIGAGSEPVTVGDLCAIHRTLMGDDPIAGEIRSVQNWIGTRYSTPLQAVFVPPPPELVPELVEDLVASINEDGHPPLVHAAVVHAQFETIHPFADGNGRTGRALIQLMLRRSGLTTSALPLSTSLVFQHARFYLGALNGARVICDANDPQRSAALVEWAMLLADAVHRAAEGTAEIAWEVAAIRLHWQDLLADANQRHSHTTARLLDALASVPMLTVNRAAEVLDANERTTRRSIQRLCDATILAQAGTNKRNRIYEATDIIDLYHDIATINPSGWQGPRPRRRWNRPLGHTPAPT